MKTISNKQILSLWVCVIYSGISFLFIGARAAWGFLKLASEYKDDLIPRETLFAVVESASKDFWNFTFIVGIGFLFLTVITVWISKK